MLNSYGRIPERRENWSRRQGKTDDQNILKALFSSYYRFQGARSRTPSCFHDRQTCSTLCTPIGWRSNTRKSLKQLAEISKPRICCSQWLRKLAMLCDTSSQNMAWNRKRTFWNFSLDLVCHSPTCWHGLKGHLGWLNPCKSQMQPNPLLRHYLRGHRKVTDSLLNEEPNKEAWMTSRPLIDPSANGFAASTDSKPGLS
jgi:hypothetical protein